MTWIITERTARIFYILANLTVGLDALFALSRVGLTMVLVLFSADDPTHPPSVARELYGPTPITVIVIAIALLTLLNVIARRKKEFEISLLCSLAQFAASFVFFKNLGNDRFWS
jgi:hypothetical protein